MGSAFADAEVSGRKIGAPSKLERIRAELAALGDDSLADFDAAVTGSMPPSELARRLESLDLPVKVEETTVAYWCRRARRSVRVQ